MQFKEWLALELNKGLARNFRSNYPHLPAYVAKQTLHNRVAPLWDKMSVGIAPTAAPDFAQNVRASMEPTANLKTDKLAPSSIYHNNNIQNIVRNKNWLQKVVTITPLDFTQETIEAFLSHEFGSSSPLSKHVKNHELRMQIQRQLANERGEGNNEPIVMVMRGGKYEMQEGWHRLYAYLLQYSAPPEEREKIKSGRSKDVDLTYWKPIQIKAWIGK